MLRRLLGWIEATLVLLCILVGGGVAAFFHRVWAAQIQQSVSERLRRLGAAQESEQLLDAAGSGGGGGGGGGSGTAAVPSRITGISGGEIS